MNESGYVIYSTGSILFKEDDKYRFSSIQSVKYK